MNYFISAVLVCFFACSSHAQMNNWPIFINGSEHQTSKDSFQVAYDAVESGDVKELSVLQFPYFKKLLDEGFATYGQYTYYIVPGTFDGNLLNNALQKYTSYTVSLTPIGKIIEIKSFFNDLSISNQKKLAYMTIEGYGFEKVKFRKYNLNIGSDEKHEFIIAKVKTSNPDKFNLYEDSDDLTSFIEFTTSKIKNLVQIISKHLFDLKIGVYNRIHKKIDVGLNLDGQWIILKANN